MKHLAAVVLFLTLASPASAQTLTPQDARATLTVARAHSPCSSSGSPTATAIGRSNKEKAWRSLTESDKARAIQADEELRQVRSSAGLETYLHRSLKPLAEVLTSMDAQTEAFENTADECTGYCFA